jgi:uncharacterized membrane protein
MRISPLSIGLLSVALATAPISAASAHEFYHHHHYGLVGGIFGLAGAVVVGAVTIVTAPIVILADAISGPRYHRDSYDQGYGGYDGRAGGYDEGSYAYGPPRASYAPPRDYAPSQDYDRARADYDTEEQAYNERSSPRGYDRDEDYSDARDPGYSDQPYDRRDDE